MHVGVLQDTAALPRRQDSGSQDAPMMDSHRGASSCWKGRTYCLRLSREASALPRSRAAAPLSWGSALRTLSFASFTFWPASFSTGCNHRAAVSLGSAALWLLLQGG